MTTWMVLRFCKWVGVLLFTAGVAGAVLPTSFADRQAAVYRLATPGFVLTWLSGYGLLREASVSMGSAWVGAGLLLSLATLQAIVWGVEREDRGRGAVGALALLGLLTTVGVMVERPGTVTHVEKAP